MREKIKRAASESSAIASIVFDAFRAPARALTPTPLPILGEGGLWRDRVTVIAIGTRRNLRGVLQSQYLSCGVADGGHAVAERTVEMLLNAGMVEMICQCLQCGKANDIAFKAKG